MQTLEIDERSSDKSVTSDVVNRWDRLCADVREFDPDVVVLVARKMPRLYEALELEFGNRAICVSDQALPFVRRDLSGAKVAIVDDVWNFGSTMTNARRRVGSYGARFTRLFALGAKDARGALHEGVHLGTSSSLTRTEYLALVAAAPHLLRRVAKPYDADFPVLSCTLKLPYTTWHDCWAWLNSQSEFAVHETNDEGRIADGRVRATVNLLHIHDWTIKIRLYFDFNLGTCNVVPMALAPSLPLKGDYPPGSLSAHAFKVLHDQLGADEHTDPGETRDALARANTFCDSLMFQDAALAAVSGLLRADSASRLATADVAMQFGSKAAVALDRVRSIDFLAPASEDLSKWLGERKAAVSDVGAPLSHNSLVAKKAMVYRNQQQPAELVLDALIQGLAEAAGTELPSKYALTEPYTLAEITDNPYLRLRIGFTFNELVAFLKPLLSPEQEGSNATSAYAVGALLDLFIDLGAIVPTIALHGKECTRIYRKGESNPRWDEEAERLRLALLSLPVDDRMRLLNSRTRLAKITAILSMSTDVPSCLRPGALERGTVGMLKRSVVERQDAEFSGLLQRTGLLSRLASEAAA